MAVRTARVPENLDLYLKILLSKGYAKTYGEAINLMILERMMKDKETGDISPFPYALVDNRKTTADLDIDKIETLNIRKNQSAPAEEAPPILDSYRFAGKASNLRDPGGSSGDCSCENLRYLLAGYLEDPREIRCSNSFRIF